MDAYLVSKVFANYSQAVSRPTFSPDDVPMFLPQLDEVHRRLDHWLEFGSNKASESRRVTYRLGSTAASRAQTDFYARIAASPAIRTICEVGFNAGHSTAIWLTSNPTAIVYSFDLFDRSWKKGATEILQRLFPNRLNLIRGSSVQSVPQWRVANEQVRCDLIHVDGMHSYMNVIADFLNLKLQASSDALYLFDDQCDPDGCRLDLIPVKGTVLACTMATCDLQSAGLLQPIVSFYKGNRQFALFRSPIAIDVLRKAETWRHEGVVLPTLSCSPLCKVKIRDNGRLETRALKVTNHTLKNQRSVRPRSCLS